MENVVETGKTDPARREERRRGGPRRVAAAGRGRRGPREESRERRRRRRSPRSAPRSSTRSQRPRPPQAPASPRFAGTPRMPRKRPTCTFARIPGPRSASPRRSESSSVSLPGAAEPRPAAGVHCCERADRSAGAGRPAAPRRVCRDRGRRCARRRRPRRTKAGRAARGGRLRFRRAPDGLRMAPRYSPGTRPGGPGPRRAWRSSSGPLRQRWRGLRSRAVTGRMRYSFRVSGASSSAIAS